MSEAFDHTVDVLVVGSGGGGMTAALAADAFGLDTLVVEKSPQFGGSTALSGGGSGCPGHRRNANRAIPLTPTVSWNTCAGSPAAWSATSG